MRRDVIRVAYIAPMLAQDAAAPISYNKVGWQGRAFDAAIIVTPPLV